MEKEFDIVFKDFDLGSNWIKTGGKIYYGETNTFQHYYEFHNKNKDTTITIILNKDTMKIYLDKEDDHQELLETKDFQQVKDFITKLI